MLKNVVLWDVTTCGVSKKLIASIIKVTKIGELGATEARCVLRLLVATNVVPAVFNFPDHNGCVA
jgi:hypothetical protein